MCFLEQDGCYCLLRVWFIVKYCSTFSLLSGLTTSQVWVWRRTWNWSVMEYRKWSNCCGPIQNLFSSAIMWCLFFSLSQTAGWWERCLCFIIFSHRSREAQSVLLHVISWAITGLLHDCRSVPLASSFSVIVVKAWRWWQPAIRKGRKGCKLQ